MKKVAWSAGHGRHTAGKRSPSDEREWTFNTKVVTAGMLYLAKYENVQQLRVDDTSGNSDISLSARTNEANNWGADIYVSSHHNALTGVWGDHSGVETFLMTPRGDNPKSLKLAQAIHPKVLKVMGLTDRGIKDINFHELRETDMPAVLVEGGFMDSRIDIKKMRDDKFLRAQGEAIAQGIAEYFGLKLKGSVTTVSNPVKEEDEMLKQAIVIGGYADYPVAEALANRINAPIYPWGAIDGEIAKELIVVGGDVKGLKADKITNLSGNDRFETAANVKKYL